MKESRSYQASQELFERAAVVIPGGVNSPVRAFRSVGGNPYFVQSAKGAHITDVDGNTYLDYVQSWGASILGHANPKVTQALAEAARDGTSYGAPTAREVELAEMIADRVPGIEMVRLVSSGTEAVMTALRLARGLTGRDRIVKFAGCYHGHSDAVLAAAGSGLATLGLPGSAGVTKNAVADTVVCPYNRLPSIGEDIACVIVEPVAANMGLVPATPAFLEGLRRACSASGALLIFDEVITGFRLGLGGAAGHYGVTPDLFTLGKVIGGGLPLAALGGPRALMNELAPVGPIYQAGTLSGNPLATAAGLAVISQLDEGGFDELEALVDRFASGMRRALQSAGLSIQVPRLGTLTSLFFSQVPVENFSDAQLSGANGLYARFFNLMLERGISLAPSPYEVVFVSLAHSEKDIDETLDIAFDCAVKLANDMRGDSSS